MLEIPNDIVKYFFKEIKCKGKYEIAIQNNCAYILPKEEERYYKPVIKIPDLNSFSKILVDYVNSLNTFFESNQMELKEYQNLSYVFNILLFNMTFSDAEDLNKFIQKRITFLHDNHLEEYNNPNKIFELDTTSFYIQREVECFGLETPYIMTFSMNVSGNNYQLPIIRYAIDNDGICYIYAVQIGKGRFCEVNNPIYKSVVNQVNQGVSKYRNISPSFILIFAMFLKVLYDQQIQNLVIPDFLFNRYRKYYRAETEKKSNEILTRMFHTTDILLKRICYQIDGFTIESYPLEGIDNYYHIKINSLKSENKMLKKLLKNNNDINKS